MRLVRCSSRWVLGMIGPFGLRGAEGGCAWMPLEKLHHQGAMGTKWHEGVIPTVSVNVYYRSTEPPSGTGCGAGSQETSSSRFAVVTTSVVGLL